MSAKTRERPAEGTPKTIEEFRALVAPIKAELVPLLNRLDGLTAEREKARLTTPPATSVSEAAGLLLDGLDKLDKLDVLDVPSVAPKESAVKRLHWGVEVVREAVRLKEVSIEQRVGVLGRDLMQAVAPKYNVQAKRELAAAINFAVEQEKTQEFRRQFELEGISALAYLRPLSSAPARIGSLSDHESFIGRMIREALDAGDVEITDPILEPWREAVARHEAAALGQVRRDKEMKARIQAQQDAEEARLRTEAKKAARDKENARRSKMGLPAMVGG